MLLVNCVCSTIRKLGIESDKLGSLVNPRRWDTEENLVGQGLAFAADNDAFSGFCFDRYMAMLHRLRGWEVKPLFVTLPDIVADSVETLILAKRWENTVRRVFRLPAAYVIQDGQSLEAMPWGILDAVFVGGSTEYKLGHEARLIIAEANARGVWVHMGRVNSRKRIRYAHNIGCDSVDGSGFNMFRDAHIPWAVELLEELGEKQMSMNTDNKGRSIAPPIFNHKPPEYLNVYANEDGTFSFHTPDYKVAFLDEFKEAVPPEMRSWDTDNQLWSVEGDWLETALDCVIKHWPKLEIIWE